MAKSQKVTVTTAADGTVSATRVDATLSDVLTTAVSTDSALTGMYGLAQKAGFVAIGMSLQSKRLRGSYNPI